MCTICKCKDANVRKTEYMKESRFSTKTEDVNDDEKKAVMQTTERMSVVYCIVMIVGSTLGGQNGSTKLVSFESLMFVLFIILFLIGNQLKGVNDLFISNTGKSEFPARRITGIICNCGCCSCINDNGNASVLQRRWW